MSPRKSDAKQKLMDTTALLLQQQGYAATGLDQILQTSQAPKGSLYYYFPEGKEQLAADALHQVGQRYSLLIAQTLQEHGLIGGFRAILTHFEHLLVSSNYTQGCPIASVAATLQPEQTTLQEACHQVFQNWQEGIAGALRAHGLPEHLSPLLLSSLEGALMLCRVHKSLEPLHTTSGALIALLEAQHDQNR
ncbi:TetR/AcrR family transcriptional regulator [Deinococcus cellulosilyticus]|uniref:TetR family transcriptional regulator n=1 Tax=Deinococcus cellulosilyticus (strain DSM 18568 / NBRC 106333 / KACC 11606 / 5516J-15) TaxID=1223518 RepID=A0A511MWX6_DEIC1|nr:TetR/AcrR family transcriptional regulator [Deinococcus cellulosilyticus]GEM45085.1 TetR family transcriptional regulator [Deinococcus cellulosilyticus NBRC 106333 = KACC 11606]